jgi:hypothetical protein
MSTRIKHNPNDNSDKRSSNIKKNLVCNNDAIDTYIYNYTPSEKMKLKTANLGNYDCADNVEFNQYTLLTYNTSFANDAHSSQLHPGLSESAAIAAKAIQVYRDLNPNAKEITFQMLEEFFKSADYLRLINVNPVKGEEGVATDSEEIDNSKTNDGVLGNFRMKLADSATDFIHSKLYPSNEPQNVNSLVGFVALIEQTIHVPKGHKAYYGGDSTNLSKKVDLMEINKEHNKKFGILRRISKLKLNDIDSTEEGNEDSDYLIVYDNIVNIKSGGSAAAEGIAIVVNQKLLSDGTDGLFKWNVDTHNIKTECKKTILNQFKYSYTGLVHYYSDDFGMCVYKYRDSDRNRVRLVKQNGVPDLGRPIILTAGFGKDSTLNIFVALHGVNILNLIYLDDNFYNKHTNIDLETDNELETKIKNFGIKPIKESNDDKIVNKIYEIVSEQIGVFIGNALDNLSNVYKNKITPGKQIQLFIGGDFNDPKGVILRKIKENGINFEFNNNKKVVFNIIFNFEANNIFSCCANRDSQLNPDTKNETLSSIENAVDRVQGINKGFSDVEPKFYVGDTVEIKNKDNTPTETFKTKKYIVKKVDYDKKLLVLIVIEGDDKKTYKFTNERESKRIIDKTNAEILKMEQTSYFIADYNFVVTEHIKWTEYANGFYTREKFGYNGDYVLFGINRRKQLSYDPAHPEKKPSLADTDADTYVIPPVFDIKLQDENDKTGYFNYNVGDVEKSVMASDHLPVYTTVIIPQHKSHTKVTGGRRRRYSMRVLKRHTKKGLPKKIRVSQRKRRARTYKKH